MTEKDLEEFEKEFGFKLLPTSFKKPLSEITKEEYRERIEYLYNAIINDDSNIDETIKDRIDELIKTYQMYIEWNKRNIEKDKENLIFKLNNGIYENIQLDTKDINMMKDDIDLYRAFIGSLEYAKTGERK
jgi:hypothetical protein